MLAIAAACMLVYVPSARGTFAEEPALIFTTYYSSTGPGGAAVDIAVDDAGEAYITGYVSGFDLPLAERRGTLGAKDAFVAKLDAWGKPLWARLFGGYGDDVPTSLDLGPDGSVVVVGTTDSGPEFPGLNALMGPAGQEDILIARFLQDGTPDLISQFGGVYNDKGFAVVRRPGGAIDVLGHSDSPSFPTSPATWTPGPVLLHFDLEAPSLESVDLGDHSLRAMAIAGEEILMTGNTGDSLVVRWMNATTFAVDQELIGSSDGPSVGLVAAIDESGFGYVAGVTHALGFPASFGSSNWGTPFYGDAFVMQFDPDRNLVFSAYLGGLQHDAPSGLYKHPDGPLVISGTTESEDFPSGEATQDAEGSAVFVTAIDVAPVPAIRGTTLVKGTDVEEGLGLAPGPLGDAYFTGYSTSRDFPLANAFQTRRVGESSPVIGRVGFDHADVAISASGDPNPVVAGGDLEVTVRVRNEAGLAATNTVANVVIRTVQTESIDPPTACSQSGDVFTCALGTVEPGEDVTLAFAVRPDDPPAPSSDLAVTARVGADQGDPDPEDNAAATAVAVLQDADRDGVADASDNCPAAANPDQFNLDADTFGDACDPDDDGDQLDDADEVQLGTDPRNPDTDGDTVGDGAESALEIDPLDPDTDGDLFADGTETSAASDPANPLSLPGGPPWPAGAEPPVRELPVLDGLPPLR